MKAFDAFRIYSDKDGHRAGLERLSVEDLPPGDVVIEARYSGINYKDALAGTGRGRILRRSPLIGGVDVAGIVVESSDDRFSNGDAVLVTGCGLGESHDGGYSEIVRVPADWVVPLPESLDLFEAMVLGSAGFTAALTVKRMEDNHQTPQHGPIVVTGATGGVGSFAIQMFSQLGYEVVAVSGRSALRDYLISLGAEEVLDRHQLNFGDRPLESTRWGGAVDNVGGKTLSWLTRTTKPWGNIASIGLVGDHVLETTVMPFILRGVSLLGISSGNCPVEWRHALWKRIGSDLKPPHLDRIASSTVAMSELPRAFDRLLDGGSHGRIVVRIKDD
ncbi:MAG: oxidoreductase [Gammaproteobacteria bacterium]|jgi:NADPH2:quinone reductase|nr:oxidoreductase [Gammaproteobacteria bacterium]